jgi:membrane protease YdiL (CAAX protease family)
MKDAAAYAVLFVLAGSLWAWTAAILRVWGRRPVLPYEPRRPVSWGLFDLLLAFIALVLFQGLAFVFLRGFLGVDVDLQSHEMQPATRAVAILASSFASLATALVSLSLVRFRTGAGWIDLGLDRRKVLADVKLGVVAFVMLAPPVYGIQAMLVRWFPSQHPLIDLLTENAGPLIYLVTGMSAILVAPVVEEYLFRVLLQGWLERAFTTREAIHDLLLGGVASAENAADHGQLPGKPAVDASARPSWPAIAISAALFAALHVSHGPDPIPLFVLALGLGYLYQRTHRILPGIIVHFLLNSVTLAALLLGLGAAN